MLLLQVWAIILNKTKEKEHKNVAQKRSPRPIFRAKKAQKTLNTSIFYGNNKNYWQCQAAEHKEKLANYLKPLQMLTKKSQARLFEEIDKELEAYLSKENNDMDSTDGIFDFLSQISDSVQEEFDEILSSDSDKKGSSGHCQKYSRCCLMQELTRQKKLNG